MDLWYNCEETGRRFIYNSSRVVLINDTYDEGPSDPMIGSNHECEGIVVKRANDDEYPIEVHWDNEHVNQYRPGDLDIIGNLPIKPSMDKDNPNAAFRAHKQKHKPLIHHSVFDEVKAVSKIREATGVSISEGNSLYHKHSGDVDAAIAHHNPLPHKPIQTGPNQHATTENLSKIDRVLAATGLSLIKARALLQEHGGDVDAAITYHNLEHGSAAKSIMREIQTAEAQQVVTELIDSSSKKAISGIIPSDSVYTLSNGEVVVEEVTKRQITDRWKHINAIGSNKVGKVKSMQLEELNKQGSIKGRRETKGRKGDF